MRFGISCDSRQSMPVVSHPSYIDLVRLTNKGVHEEWMKEAIRIVALRAILTLKELLNPIKVTRPRVQFEDGLFDFLDE